MHTKAEITVGNWKAIWLPPKTGAIKTNHYCQRRQALLAVKKKKKVIKWDNNSALS